MKTSRLITLEQSIREMYPKKQDRVAFLADVEKIRERNHREYQRETAAKLRKSRIEVGLSQQQLAYRIHVPRTQVTRMESGRQNITLKTMERACHAMGRQLRVTIV